MRIAVVALLLLAGQMPVAAHAQTVAPPSAAVQELTSTPAYPYTDTAAPPGSRVASVRKLQTVQTPSGREVVANRVLVKFAAGVPNADQAAIHARAAALGAGVAQPVKALVANVYLVDVSGASSVEAAASAYRTADSRVVSAAPDSVVHAIESTNDPLQGSQQNLSRIQVREAWDRTHGDARRIAIVDSGIYQNHPDLVAKIDGAVNTQWGNYSHDDRLGHGTHVAGVAAAMTDNGEGVAGIGFNAHLLNVKAIDDYGTGSAGSVADGIIWAADRNAQVINLSLAGSRDCEPWWIEDWTDTGVAYLRDAIDYAFSRGVVIVAGAGNTGGTGKLYPAACPHVLSVANTTSTDGKASDSTFGTWVQVAAPGSSILSTALPIGTHCVQDLQGWYARCSGTSIAAPHVSGLAALVQTSCAPIGPQAVIDRIMSTSDKIPGTGTFWQAGRINARQAVCLPNPTGLSITTATDSSLSFVWNDRSTTESSFEFAWRPAGGVWQTVTLPANSTNTMTYTLSGLVPLATYEFHVRACDVQGCSLWSNLVTGQPNAFQLHVFVTGTGRVSSSPTGIDCGFMRLDCTEYYRINTVVGLVPFPLVNPTTHDEFEFDHWEGACTGQSYSCTVTVNQALTARAVFVKIGNSGP